jgi:predicted ATPase
LKKQNNGEINSKDVQTILDIYNNIEKIDEKNYYEFKFKILENFNKNEYNLCFDEFTV